jgi:hypothetical protein
VVAICQALRLCADIRFSDALRVIRRKVAKRRRETDSVLPGISLEGCANVTSEPGGAIGYSASTE